MTLDAHDPIPVPHARQPTVLVIGVGNRFARDDGFGPAVLDRFRQLCPGVPAVETDGEAARLVEAWDNADAVVIVDAVRSGSPPGTDHRIVLHTGLPADLGLESAPTSSHAAGVAEAWALGTAIGRTPERLILLGVEGAEFGPGDQMTLDVARAVPRTARAVEDEVRAVRAPADRSEAR